jgi:Domain of unknown function (DUF4357)
LEVIQSADLTMAGATITVHLPTADPQGLRIAELSNWNGKALASPRTALPQLLAREEMTGAGIYLLIGAGGETSQPRLYVGEAENLALRLKGHAKVEFWVQAIAFMSQGDTLTKAHVKYLEGCLIEKAKLAGRAQLENSNASGAKLPEADRSDMREFLERLLLLLPILGCDLLTPLASPATSRSTDRLTCHYKGLRAYGNRTPKGFVVFKDSEAASDLVPWAAEKAKWLQTLRERLLAAKVLVPEMGHLRFARDYQFASPTAAAAVIRGNHANGLTEWRNSEGVPLKNLDVSV